VVAGGVRAECFVVVPARTPSSFTNARAFSMLAPQGVEGWWAEAVNTFRASVTGRHRCGPLEITAPCTDWQTHSVAGKLPACYSILSRHSVP